MEDLSLHILDIVENSIRAGAKRVKIKIDENLKKDVLKIEMNDDGFGMDEETVKKATDPFFTTKKTRKVGLGLSLLAQAANECDGKFEIKSKKGIGTKITASFKHSHIDRKPIGDMKQTIMTLIAGNPEIDFFYQHKKENLTYSLDTDKIKADLDEIPINNVEVLKLIQKDLMEDLK
ncbi:MAG: ATP-binding protein [bacterium]